MDLNQSGKEKPDNTGKNNSKKPKLNFNFYWIYAIIAVVFFAMQFLNWGSGAKLSNWENLGKRSCCKTFRMTFMRMHLRLF